MCHFFLPLTCPSAALNFPLIYQLFLPLQSLSFQYWYLLCLHIVCLSLLPGKPLPWSASSSSVKMWLRQSKLFVLQPGHPQCLYSSVTITLSFSITDLHVPSAGLSAPFRPEVVAVLHIFWIAGIKYFVFAELQNLAISKNHQIPSTLKLKGNILKIRPLRLKEIKWFF